MSIDMENGRVPVTVLRLEGELDASNYEQLISRTEALYEEGTRALLLDLDKVDFVSSSGLIGLHSAALIMRGETLDDAEEGWAAFRAVSRDMIKSSSQEAHFKLLKPQPIVRKVLDTSGFSEFMPIFDDEQTAVASFD
ncbi:MAG: STAS domain-containing protein [Candidatus Promineifilaceae bacterium]